MQDQVASLILRFLAWGSCNINVLVTEIRQEGEVLFGDLEKEND